MSYVFSGAYTPMLCRIVEQVSHCVNDDDAVCICVPSICRFTVQTWPLWEPSLVTPY